MTEERSLNPEVRRGETESRPDQQSWLDRAGVGTTAIGKMLKERFAYEERLSELQARMPTRQEIPEADDLEVYHELMAKIVDNLNSSDTILRARQKVKEDGYAALTDSEREGLLRAFDRARDQAFKQVTMSPRQKRQIRFAAISQLNYSLRNYLHNGSPESWMILEPKMRRVDFMSSQQIIRFLRNSGNERADVEFISEEAQDPEAAESVKQADRELALTAV
ncbi:MAG: hypothetical protein V1838_00125 [Patescibacteria group bacterium]